MPITDGVPSEFTLFSPFYKLNIELMIGLAGGMVLAPWLERWYRGVAKPDPEESDE